MTKAQVEEILRRYSHIKKVVLEGGHEARFYVGHRKKKIVVDENVKTVISIIDEICEQEKDQWLKKLIEGIKNGETDKYLIERLPMDKNTYYDRKKKFINKIYQCCICKGLVGYEEILKESIG